MENQWYIQADGDEVEGPVTAPLLKQWVDMGKVKPNTKLRRGTSGPWVFASRVRGLFSSTGSPDDVDATGLPPAEPSFVSVGWSAPSPPATARAQLVPCADCGKDVSRRAVACPHCGVVFPRPVPPDKYPALLIVAKLLKVLAVFAAVGCLAGLILAIAGAGGVPGTMVIQLVVYLVLGPVSFWGSAELIVLLIDIEQNTRPPTPKEKD